MNMMKPTESLLYAFDRSILCNALLVDKSCDSRYSSILL